MSKSAGLVGKVNSSPGSTITAAEPWARYALLLRLGFIYLVNV